MSDGVRFKIEAIELKVTGVEKSQIRMEDKIDFLINSRLEEKVSQDKILVRLQTDVDKLKHWRTALSAGFAAVLMWIQHKGGRP